MHRFVQLPNRDEPTLSRTHLEVERNGTFAALMNRYALGHELLAMMLGVRRQTTVVAGALQSAGLIAYVRGQVHVLDRKGLEAAPCECYALIAHRWPVWASKTVWLLQTESAGGGRGAREGRRFSAPNGSTVA